MRTTIIGGSKRTWSGTTSTPPSGGASTTGASTWPRRTKSATDERHDMIVSYRLGDMVAPALSEREALGSMMEEFGYSIRQARAPLTDG